MLVEEFLKPLGISQAHFARHIGVPYVRLNEIVHGKRGISPNTAVRFARALGTTPQFWLNGQMLIDLYDELHTKRKAQDIQPITVVSAL
jgi:addiction module HigA family antidote